MLRIVVFDGCLIDFQYAPSWPSVDAARALFVPHNELLMQCIGYQTVMEPIDHHNAYYLTLIKSYVLY